MGKNGQRAAIVSNPNATVRVIPLGSYSNTPMLPFVLPMGPLQCIRASFGPCRVKMKTLATLGASQLPLEAMFRYLSLHRVLQVKKSRLQRKAWVACCTRHCLAVNMDSVLLQMVNRIRAAIYLLEYLNTYFVKELRSKGASSLPKQRGPPGICRIRHHILISNIIKAPAKAIVESI